MNTFILTLKKKLPMIGIVAALLMGAYLRFDRIAAYLTFLGDEGRDMLVVLHMIVNHKFTLLGPTASVGGFFLGPIYYYFMLPFVWLSGINPAGAAVMVALFGTATIYIVYRMGRDMFDQWVGLMAATLYALSPLVITYSRSSWNPNLVPFFSTLLMYLCWKSVTFEKPKLLFWIGVILGIGLQLHYLFLFMFAVVFLWFLLLKRQWDWLAYYMLAVAGFIVGYGPFLVFEIRHGFPNTISIVRFLMAGKDTGFVFATFVSTIIDVAHRLFGRLLFRLPQPEQLVHFSPLVQNVWQNGILIVPFVAVVVCLFALRQVIGVPWKAQERERNVSWKNGLILLLLWFLVPLTLFGLYKKGIYDYYFGLFFALPFLMIAIVLRLSAVKLVGKILVTGICVALMYFNWLGRPTVNPPNNQLGQTKLIAKVAFEKTEGKPFNFALMTGGNSDHAYRFFFELWNHKPVTIENLVIDPKRTTVTDQLIVICELSDCKPLGSSLWEIAGFGRAEISSEWHESFVTIFKLTHYKGPAT